MLSASSQNRKKAVRVTFLVSGFAIVRPAVQEFSFSRKNTVLCFPDGKKVYFEWGMTGGGGWGGGGGGNIGR